MFSELVEQKAAKALLASDIKRERLAPFYLFTGPQGVGKALTARLFAKYVLCEKCGAKEDCACKSCRLFNSGNHPDFLHEALEGDTEIKVETVDEIRHFLSSKPMLSRRRAVLVEDAERLNQHAQNGLLKSLEEPPPGTVLILTVNRLEAMLETIPSRARLVRFGNLSSAGMEEVLKIAQIPSAEIPFLVDTGAGSPGRALGFSSHSKLVSDVADAFHAAVKGGVSPVDLETTVAAALAGLADNAERRDFLVELITVLSIRWRRELAPLGSEPLGTVVSVLVEAYRAVKQNVTPELIVLNLASRLLRALSGEPLPGRGVFV
jgi:DNA polymerase III delta' subunit